MGMKIIGISDIEGFRLGNAENKEKGTGCTVIVCEDGAVGGVDVRGGGPATRETDLLRSENTVNAVNAVVLSGGSAFGLEAASGVMRELADRKIGFDVGEGIVVPIVCGASLFDLAVGDHSAFPDVGMGMQAVRNAYVEGGFSRGNHGAGTGATVGKIKGHDRAMKTGLGTFACGDGFIEVGAVTAVNAVGDVYNGAGNIIAGLRSEDGGSIYGTIKTLKSMVHDNTVSVDESTAFIDRADVDQAISFSDTEDKPAGFSDTSNTEDKVISFADLEDEVKDADEVTVYETEEAADPHDPETASPEAEPEEQQDTVQEEEPKRELTSEEMGYDIAFNTTISCLITNADLTKSQANKLASILHDAYARAIKPVHGTLDGDTIFVLASGKQKVNFDAFAALATDVMQYAIIDGAMSAEGEYGLPAARDMQNTGDK
jgi:L-aminopeptidase/D-esterase-like protein